MIDVWSSVDGQIAPAEQACVGVLDRGFLYGDSVYEVLRTFNGRPLFWKEHADRLWRSASLLGIDLGVEREILLAETQALLSKLAVDSAYLRIVVTRGPETFELQKPGKPTRVLIARRLPEPDPALLRDGCVLASFATGRADEGGLNPKAKSGNTLLAVLAHSAAQHSGAYEALRIDPLGRILEGSRTTFFAVCNGRVLTPPLAVGILEGITRQKVLELARQAGLEAAEEELHRADIERAGVEAFITGTTRGVTPVCRLDDFEFGPPGPITLRLKKAYDELIARSGSD